MQDFDKQSPEQLQSNCVEPENGAEKEIEKGTETFNSEIEKLKIAKQKNENTRDEKDHKTKMGLCWFLMLYLCCFTFILFNTLRRNESSFHLQSSTLNLLITFGFVKIVALIAIVVKHFFPLSKK